MKLALIGSGKIMMMALDALKTMQGIELVALCVRSESTEKGETLCQQFGIAKLYTDYQKVLQDDEIDTVYIGLPNHLHYQYTQQALLADKHVICEKPFTPHWEQLQELILLSQKRDFFYLKRSPQFTLQNLRLFSKISTKLAK